MHSVRQILIYRTVFTYSVYHIYCYFSIGRLYRSQKIEKRRFYPPLLVYLCFILFAEVSFEKTCECLAVSCFVTETLKNTAKTGIFNRLAQNQHKNIKIYAVDFSS